MVPCGVLHLEEDTSSRTPKQTNGVARKALSVESDGEMPSCSGCSSFSIFQELFEAPGGAGGASQGRLKRKAMATKNVDRSEEAPAACLPERLGAHAEVGRPRGRTWTKVLQGRTCLSLSRVLEVRLLGVTDDGPESEVPHAGARRRPSRSLVPR